MKSTRLVVSLRQAGGEGGVGRLLSVVMFCYEGYGF